MDVQPSALHQRAPVSDGSSNEVQLATRYYLEADCPGWWPLYSSSSVSTAETGMRVVPLMRAHSGARASVAWRALKIGGGW